MDCHVSGGDSSNTGSITNDVSGERINVAQGNDRSGFTDEAAGGGDRVSGVRAL